MQGARTSLGRYGWVGVLQGLGVGWLIGVGRAIWLEVTARDGFKQRGGFAQMGQHR